VKETPKKAQDSVLWMKVWAKVNVDASLEASSGQAGLRDIIRDHQEKIILASWTFIPTEGAEILACL
jgi:hypothetical protein